jgi:hypothetical protein
MAADCRTQCIEAGEGMVGTADAGAHLVALAWPKPRWHPDDAYLSEGLPPQLAELARRSVAAGSKLAVRAFQRAPQPPTDAIEVILTAPAQHRSLHAHGIALEKLVPLIEDFVAGRADGPPAPRLLLVCTDGKHDRCCATRGRGLYEALLAASRAQSGPCEIAESSHLGGHRFAATCLLLPDGLMHGRLEPADAKPLLRALGRGRPLLPRYRGRVCLGEPQQVAEAWALARFPDAAELEVGSDEPCAEGVRVSVSLRSNGEAQQLWVQCRERRLLTPTSCGAEPLREARTRWVAVGVDGAA